MKVQIGVSTKSGFAHSVVASANEALVTQTEHLLHEEENGVFLDSGYIGADKHEELNHHDINWRLAMKRGQFKVAPGQSGFGQLLCKLELLQASIR